MIRKLIYMCIALFFAMTQAKAQEVNEESATLPKDSMKVVLDSLRQVVSSLSTTVQSNSEEMHNRKIWKDRAKYFNISYVDQSLTLKDDDVTWRNKMGAAITAGRTYYLHKKPLFGMIKFGIDWSYLDINFAYYEDKFDYFYNEDADYNSDYDYGYDEEKEKSAKMYQVEAGMQIGPSITINPIDHLKINGYFRFAPSASILYWDDSVGANYASFFLLGGSISYKVISFGIEGRWGTTKYNNLFDEDDYEEGYNTDYESPVNTAPKPKWKTGSTRFYVSFRF